MKENNSKTILILGLGAADDSHSKEVAKLKY